jgi:hypothetical protein
MNEDDLDEYEELPKQEKFRASPVVVNVKIYDNGELIRHHRRNIRKGNHKDWLISAIMWACQNGKSIEIERIIT